MLGIRIDSRTMPSILYRLHIEFSSIIFIIDSCSDHSFLLLFLPLHRDAHGFHSAVRTDPVQRGHSPGINGHILAHPDTLVAVHELFVYVPFPRVLLYSCVATLAARIRM